MSSNLGQHPPDWAQVGGQGGHLDPFIEGPLAQIEAARKALHSPSLVNNRHILT